VRRRALELLRDALFAAGDGLMRLYLLPGAGRFAQRVVYEAAWWLDEKAGRTVTP
jgi:hypothetical protein